MVEVFSLCFQTTHTTKPHAANVTISHGDVPVSTELQESAGKVLSANQGGADFPP